MWQALASLALNKINSNNAEDEAQRQSFYQGIADRNNNMKENAAKTINAMNNYQPVTQNGHIDIQSIIDGVFTKNKNGNSSLPSGFLGV